jgi:hypothetical protein
MTVNSFFSWARLGGPIHIGITYWYRRGWPSDADIGGSTLPFESDGMPNSHELSIGLLFFRMGIEVETSIPNEE